ncbi:hypothetical protein HPB50_016627 [Hyalomma asiaticum]|uniref:Uncharacterized protein n=1 Tax=Hyalomma asiaticum TaxID=266040 RepID=A0ACB7T6I8_HYAAI|nr:hypothetical protein HPB50_016627 [Hyalomma asiaticum]
MNSVLGRADVRGHSKTSRPDVGKIVGPDLVFCKWPGCLPTVGNWSANGFESTSWFPAVLVRASLGPHARPEHLPTVAGAGPLRFWDYSPLNMVSVITEIRQGLPEPNEDPSSGQGSHELLPLPESRALRSSRRTAQSRMVETEATATRAFLRCFPGVLGTTRTLAASPFGTVCRSSPETTFGVGLLDMVWPRVSSGYIVDAETQVVGSSLNP